MTILYERSLPGSGGIAGKSGAKALRVEEHGLLNAYSQNNISIPPVALGYSYITAYRLGPNNFRFAT